MKKLKQSHKKFDPARLSICYKQHKTSATLIKKIEASQPHLCLMQNQTFAAKQNYDIYEQKTPDIELKIIQQCTLGCKLQPTICSWVCSCRVG